MITAQQTTPLSGLEDFELLNEGRDVVTLNGQLVLYMGMDNGSPVVLQRTSGYEITERLLNREHIQIKQDGSIRCIGQGAFKSTIFAAQGERYECARGFDARDAMLSRFNARNIALAGVGL